MVAFSPPYLEWEILRDPITMTKVNGNPELPKGKKKIRIYRDADYNIKAILDFQDPVPKGVYLKAHANVAGGMAKTFDIQGSFDYGASCVIESALIGDTKITRVLDGEEQNSGTATVHFRGLRIKYNNKNEGSHLIEWYLNGPTQQTFWGSTKRKEIKTFTRDRYESEENKIDSIEISGKSHEITGDFLRIKLPDIEFLVARVPDEFRPEWSTNIGIEYRTSWGGIPDALKREKIEELCSFVFGRQLLSIGYTVFDQKENLVEGYSHDPWGKNARSFCSNIDYPPIKIDVHTRGRAKNLISQLLPKYFELSVPLQLTEAIWNIWVSRQMPVGPNIPILAAALESIMHGWFKSKSVSHGVYMKKKDFLDLVEKEIITIRKKLDELFKTEETTTQKIIDKMLRANEFGIMERYRIFFKEIGLTLEPKEWKAINERHKFIHGNAIFKEANWKKVMNHVNTYETLLNKVILKLIGYSGNYIDRSSIGWKSEQLN